MRRGSGAIVVVAVIAIAATAPAGMARAHAAQFEIGGKPWPGHVITYFNGVPEQRQAIAAAAAAWNASGVNVRFRPASRSQADVVIEPIPLNYPKAATGEATLGYTSRRTATIDPYAKLRFGKDGRPLGVVGLPKTYYGAHMWLRRRADVSLQDMSPFDVATVAAHEFGHVLGLDHSRARCAVMRPSRGDPKLCGLESFEYYCGILAPDDIQGAARLYGGSPSPSSRKVCASAGPLASPGSLAADTSDGGIRLTWKVPPGASGPGPAKVIGAIVMRARGTCPTHANTDQLPTPPAGPFDDSLPSSGSWCYSVWFVRLNGQTSTNPATVGIDVP